MPLLDDNSVSVTTDPNSYPGISVMNGGKVRMINCPPEILTMVKDAVQELYDICGEDPSKSNFKEHFGTYRIRLPKNRSFDNCAGTDHGTCGKLFGLKLFGKMEGAGWETVCSSDLARQHDYPTWYFRRRGSGDTTGGVQDMAFVGVGGTWTDTLTLIECNNSVTENVKLAISECWPKGIDNETTDHTLGISTLRIKLKGKWGGKGTDGIQTGKMICNLVSRLGGQHYRLVIATNIKSNIRSTDSFYFIKDASYNCSDFVLISASNKDKVRLINCNSLAPDVRRAIEESGQKIQDEKDFCGSVEFKIKGRPWWSSGDESIRANRMMSRIFETMGRHYYLVARDIKTSATLSDKSSLLFSRTMYPVDVKFACITLSGHNHVRWLDFPSNVTEDLKQDMIRIYAPGINKSEEIPDIGWEMETVGWCLDAMILKQGNPAWHLRSALGVMFQTAEKHGYMAVISADLSAKYHADKHSKYPLDTDTIFFVKHAAQ